MVKSLIAFSHVLLHDMEEWCGVSAPRDHKTITSRVEHEGMSFLTITLPAFAKDFERGLEQQRVTDDLFLGFARTGGLPRFLGGFLRLVFDSCTGVLLNDPSKNAISAIRQFSMAFAKIRIECSPERVRSAFDGYIQCELDIRESDTRWEAQLPSLRRVAFTLFGELFSEIDRKVFYDELLPKHGPGSTADRLLGNEKFDHRTWTVRLDRYFPVESYLVPNHGHWQHLQSTVIHEPENELPVRVIAVPKTLKTPRIIAIEPTCMQYAQQALLREFVEGIESSDSLSPFIGFTDQVPNRSLAREGSLSGKLATLDMSEASDRVSNQHVLALMGTFSHLYGALQACRSTKADVPGHGVITISKFASMGSAVCFPVEAMVFLAIIFHSIAEQLSTTVTPQLISEMRGRVRVYGDDIIVPSTFALSLIHI